VHRRSGRQIACSGGRRQEAAERRQRNQRQDPPVVEVHRRAVGVLRVHHAADARREEGHAALVPGVFDLLHEVRVAGGGAVGLGGHRAVDDAHVDAGLRVSVGGWV